MGFKMCDYAITAAAIRRNGLTGALREVVRQILDRGNGSALLAEILSQEKARLVTPDEAIQSALALLEALDGADRLVGRCLMVHLWPIASGQMDHDVCDSISLWMVDAPTGELGRYLRTVTSAEEDQDLRRVYEGWLSNFPNQADNGME